MTRDTRGVALPMALMVLVLVEGFAALALSAATTRYRITGDVRLAVESRLIAATAVAKARVDFADTLGSLSDGEHLTLPAVPLGSGWLGRTDATRRGALVRLAISVERRRADGRLLAGRRVTLLLIRGPADTLRVLRSRPRF